MSNNVPTPVDQADPIRPHRTANWGSTSVLSEHAAEIRRLGRRVVGDVIEIGARLTECKRLCGGHGYWLPWLDREFGWTDKTAERLMSVHALSGKFDNLSDLELPISGLYLLAAPSTPEPAKTEIIERAKAGEKVSIVEVKRTIDAAKGHKQPVRRVRVTKNGMPSRDDIGSNSASDVARLQARVEEVESENQRLQARLEEAKSENRQLKRENGAFKFENDALRSEVEELRLANATGKAVPPAGDGLDMPDFLDRTRGAS